MNKDYSQTFEKLKQYIHNSSSNNVAWIGDTHSPLGATQIVLNYSTNMRADSQHHREYDTVVIYAKSIFEYLDSWRLILDESIRLLKNKGVFIIRSTDSEFGTLFELKSLLYRNKLLNVVLLEQFKCLDGSTVSVLKIKKESRIDYQDKSWTFGILSNGKKIDEVISLVSSIVKANKQSLPLELVIAGPEIEQLNNFDLPVKYVTPRINDDLPRIAEKKNKIIETAAHSNIAIFHDRYIVNEDFFDGFEHFGYDFEFLTVRQFYHDGSDFPGYTAFIKKEKRWQTPLNIKNHDVGLPGAFLNGGLTILKRNIPVFPIFNDLLLHNEAEDVELGFYLTENGMTPRFNGFSSAVTVGIPLDYTSTFVEYTQKTAQRPFILRAMRRVAVSIWVRLPVNLKDKIKSSKLYGKIKNTVRPG